MESAIRLKLGKKIKELRIKRKLTQEGLSEASGIDYTYSVLKERTRLL